MPGEELTPATIRLAYESACFPMADENGEIGWYRPRARAIFPLDRIQISRSMRRMLRSDRFRVTFDQAFEEVVWSCRRPDGNWISPEIIRAYTEVHNQGWAHSCEVWEGELLVGGLYGVSVGACFCAESMFHRATNASKLALIRSLQHCLDLGYLIFDAQIMNPHLASMGAIEITEVDYWHRLQEAIRAEARPWLVS